jgi:hypothetical protein
MKMLNEQCGRGSGRQNRSDVREGMQKELGKVGAWMEGKSS